MKRPIRETDENREKRVDKLFIARYPDRDKQRAVDPSSFYTVRNKKGELYAPTHNSSADDFFGKEDLPDDTVPLARKVIKKPKHKVRVNKPFFRTVVVLTTLALLTAAFFILRIDLISVTGVSGPVSERIIGSSGIKKGSPIWLADLNKAKAGIESDPYIKVGRIEREYPSTIVIEAEERKEAAAIEYMGTFIVIDREGHVLSIGERENTDGLIRIKGLRLTGCQVNRDLSETADIFISALIDTIGAIEDQGLADSILEMDLSNPLGIRLTALEGLSILIGQPERLDEKLMKLNELLPILKARGIAAGTLDLSAKAEPVYSPPPEADEESAEGEEKGEGEEQEEDEGQAGEG
jgi:cell division protein FtsQ